MSKATHQLNVRISTELHRRLKELQRDNLTGRTRYGSMTMLIESLLWGWVQQQTSDKPKDTPQ